MDSSILKPAAELARTNKTRFPNESAEYRRAREALLAEEIELRRHIERVAEQRRALPPGGEVTRALCVSRARSGKVDLAGAVRRQADARRLQLHVRTAARAAVPDVHLASERVGRRSSGYRAAHRASRWSRARRSSDWSRPRRQRGWQHLPQVYSDRRAITPATTSARPMTATMPGFNVFTRRDGAIRHFWSGEMGQAHGRSGPGPARRARPDPLGPCSTRRRKAAARTGIRSWDIETGWSEGSPALDAG